MKARGLVIALALTVILLVGGCVVPITPTPTATPAPTATPTPTRTPTPTPTPPPTPAVPIIVTVAGSPLPLGDGGLATAAQLISPYCVSLDSGNLYIGDQGNNRVRRVSLATGTITTAAGTGVAGFRGDGGPATAAQLNSPSGVLVGSGNLYIADRANNRVRRVDLATGIITTVAGSGVAGSDGDAGLATLAQLNAPYGFAIGSGNLYISENLGHRIRRVDLATGTITNFAGTGVAGSAGDGGPATAAQLNGPVGLAVDSVSLYISDSANSRVRRVDLSTVVITTFAGTGTNGFGGDGGPATAAQLNNPGGLA